MPIRRYRYQAIHNNETTLHVEGDITIQQGLATGQTTVCQFDVWSSPTLKIGDRVYVRQVDVPNALYRPVFRGTINRIETTRHPHQSTVFCQAELAKLRRARLHSDHEVTGLTDGQAVRYALDYCRVAYDPADIGDLGYVLGAREKIYFKKGQSGLDFITQIDEALGMTTTDCHPGRVMRYRYSLIPGDYAGGAVRSYRTTDAGLHLYGSQRSRGNRDEVRNAVIVTGPTWECGPEDACSCTPTGESEADNPALGTGVRTAVNSMTYEILQDASSVGIAARRLMREGNREPDTMNLEVANDPGVYPGRVVSVFDPAYGIGLVGDAKYVVTDVVRTSDLMTLSLVGGAAGTIGAVDAYVDMQCNENESRDTLPDDGLEETNPDDLPDVPPFECSDVPPEPVNTTDPFIDCTELEGFGTSATYTGPEGYVPVSAVDDGAWRREGAQVAYHMHCDGGSCFADELAFYGGGSALAYLNLATPYSAKTSATDESWGTAPVWTVSFDVKFEREGGSLIADFGAGEARLFAAPGQTYAAVGVGDLQTTAQLHTEDETAYLAGTLEEHVCNHPSTYKNNGGVRVGGGFPVGAWVSVTLTYDYGGWPMRVYYDGPEGGYIESTATCDPFESSFPPEPCTHPAHTFHLQAFTSIGTTADDPDVRIRGLVMGHTTCTANPNYGAEIPDAEDWVPCSLLYDEDYVDTP